jgi:hypothetical protein
MMQGPSPLPLAPRANIGKLRASSRGDVAQLGERRVRNAKVGGSIPPVSTNPFR